MAETRVSDKMKTNKKKSAPNDRNGETRGVDHLLEGDGGPRSKGGIQVAPASVASWVFLRRRRDNWLAKAISFTFECCLSDF